MAGVSSWKVKLKYFVKPEVPQIQDGVEAFFGTNNGSLKNGLFHFRLAITDVFLAVDSTQRWKGRGQLLKNSAKIVNRKCDKHIFLSYHFLF